MAARPKRILIFNVNWLGDVLFSTATIRNIRNNFPDSFIACVVPSRCYPILKGNPHLNEIIIFDEKDRHKSVVAQLEFVRSLRDRHFDAVYLLHRSFTRTLICRLAGIPERIGYQTRKRGFLLTTKIAAPAKDSLHRIDYYLNIIEKSGLHVEDRYTEFFFEEEDAAFVDAFLAKEGILPNDLLAVLNPGGNWIPKRWPAGHWAELADRLIDTGLKVVISGSRDDVSLAGVIASRMKARPVLACGVLSIKQLGALCRKAEVFVTADTGPLHIATAVGSRKIVALFGPTSVQVTGPFPLRQTVILQKDAGCRLPCYEAHCKDNRCMKLITPEEVFDAVKGLVRG